MSVTAELPIPPWEPLPFSVPEEARSTHRFPVRRAALLESGSGRWTAVLEDITHGGLGLVSAVAPPPSGTALSVTILLDGTTVELPGKVAWFWNEGERWRIGLHLDTRSAEPSDRKVFQRWVARLELEAAAAAF